MESGQWVNGGVTLTLAWAKAFVGSEWHLPRNVTFMAFFSFIHVILLEKVYNLSRVKKCCKELGLMSEFYKKKSSIIYAM